MEDKIIGGCESSGRLKTVEEPCRHGGGYCRRGRRQALPTVQFCLGQLIAAPRKLPLEALGNMQ